MDTIGTKWVENYKEYVASLIGLYKNNGALLCVWIDVPDRPGLYSDSELDRIYSWADINPAHFPL